MKLATFVLVSLVATWTYADTKPAAAPPATAPTPATAPANQPAAEAHPFEKLVNTMPKNLWPSKDETKAMQQLRAEWLKAHITAETLHSWNWSGTVTDVSKKTTGEAVVQLQGDSLTLCGKIFTPKIVITVSHPDPDLFELAKGQRATLIGVPIIRHWWDSTEKALDEALKGNKDLLITAATEQPKNAQTKSTPKQDAPKSDPSKHTSGK